MIPKNQAASALTLDRSMKTILSAFLVFALLFSMTAFLPATVSADDPCADGEKGAAEGERFLKRAGLVRAEHKSYERMRHEILNEPEAEKPIHDMLNRLVAWL